MDSKIIISEEINYIAMFLTMRCNLNCAYCINLNEGGSTRKSVCGKEISAEEWVKGINRIVINREDLPVTLQGGEPTIHKEFYDIVNGVKDEIKLDLLTNLMFDEDEFIKKIDPKKFTRDAKYAAIRASYHPGQNDIEEMIRKVLKMKDAGFYVGLYSVMVPELKEHIGDVMNKCISLGIDFRVKEYLGFDGREWHGHYKYMDAIDQKDTKYCECKTTELIVGPSGGVYRCHSDLYALRDTVGNLLDTEYQLVEEYRPCYHYGHCNPCDIKVKTNRLQEYGHTSVSIRNVKDLSSDKV